MFFYIFICLASIESDYNYIDILEDPTTKGNMYLEIPAGYSDNSDIFKYIMHINEFYEIKEFVKIAELASFYYDEIKKYTGESSHQFLLRFTTIICYIVYNNVGSESLEKYRPELLFNLISFGKFIEIYISDVEIRSLVKESLIFCLFEIFQLKENFDFSKNKNVRKAVERFIDPKNILNSMVNEKPRLTCSKKNDSIFHKLGNELSNATFEYFFVFFSVLKSDFFAKNFNIVLGSTVGSSVTDINVDESFQNSTKTAINILIEVINDFDHDKRLKILEYISKPIFKDVLKNQSELNTIFDFPRNRITSYSDPKVSRFPGVFIELFCQEADVNRINVLYDFLIEKTKQEYHKYISAIICLKAFCLKDGILEQNKAIRIIMEFIFLAKVLKIESEKTVNVKEIQRYRNAYIDAMKKAIGIQNMKYAINTDTGFLDESKVPRSSILLEIFVLVDLFSNDEFKKFLNTEINKKLEGNQNKRPGNSDQVKTDYLIYIFKHENTRPKKSLKRMFFF
ncbi:hypothetical protein CWI37_1384p0010 [Hamiltosporidium tvaerminnensis]|uniref:Uncharacterized protein n=1 Tax=Hamiltosporidium tvaerminnensis TaxID=1176355 RepID=A0A4Q9KWQ3_9MICR|nr:hypothetical protein CWI37_1384p0010 [Hamiltosporidium tvaerminnensis]